MKKNKVFTTDWIEAVLSKLKRLQTELRWFSSKELESLASYFRNVAAGATIIAFFQPSIGLGTTLVAIIGGIAGLIASQVLTRLIEGE